MTPPKCGPEVSRVYAEAIFSSLQELDISTAITTIALINAAYAKSLSGMGIDHKVTFQSINERATWMIEHNAVSLCDPEQSNDH